MNEEQFRRAYEDSHTELTAIERLSKTSLIEKHPSDKNISVKGKIPGKNIIEREAFEKRAENLQHMLMDAISVKAGEVLLVPVDKLINLAIKTMPQKVDGHHEHVFTFFDLVKKASLEVETYETIDAVQPAP